MREELNGILAARSGQDIEVVARDTDRDNFICWRTKTTDDYKRIESRYGDR